MTAKEEVLETIRLWIAAQRKEAPVWESAPRWEAGYIYALDDLTELLDSL